MLKVLLLLDCDNCGHPMSQSATSADRDPFVWRAVGEDLIYEATKQGWEFHGSDSSCPACNFERSITPDALEPIAEKSIA